MKAYDKNGIEITLYDTVDVPEPNATDLHLHGFRGKVGGFRNGLVLVKAADEDGFEIEPERLEVV